MICTGPTDQFHAWKAPREHWFASLKWKTNRKKLGHFKHLGCWKIVTSTVAGIFWENVGSALCQRTSKLSLNKKTSHSYDMCFHFQKVSHIITHAHKLHVCFYIHLQLRWMGQHATNLQLGCRLKLQWADVIELCSVYSVYRAVTWQPGNNRK